jgi:hypothetical protein
MYHLKVVTFALIGMGFIPSWALAQSGDTLQVTHEMRQGNLGGSEPKSNRASNLVPEDTRSNIAPSLPDPRIGSDAAPRDYVRAARDALIAGRTGVAQQSLEMAETRALTRSAAPSVAGMPDTDPEIMSIQNALRVLGQGDKGRALQIIDAMVE